MPKFMSFIVFQVYSVLVPNMLEAAGERRASEAKRIALVSDYSKKAVTFLGGALLKKMLG